MQEADGIMTTTLKLFCVWFIIRKNCRQSVGW